MNFIKVGSACPVTKVADVDFNVENINLCIDEAYDKAYELLRENTSKLHAVAQALIEKEKLDANEFEEIFANN